MPSTLTKPILVSLPYIDATSAALLYGSFKILSSVTSRQPWPLYTRVMSRGLICLLKRGIASHYCLFVARLATGQND